MSIISAEASLSRLERALSRLERAIAAGERARVAQGEAFERLDSRHGLLRARVAETIARLDSLIADGGVTR